FKTHQREVYGWIVRLVHDRASAEDLTIETFWRVYRSRARFDPARPFVAWLRRIAVNVGIDHLKRSARDRPEARDVEDLPAKPQADVRDAREALARAFRTLPPA